VEITGLVARPVTLSLADLMARPRREVEFTLECSGNTGLPFFIGGIGNAVWGGTQLSSVLRRARPLDSASEVVFWGTDAGTVTIRDNSGVLSAGTTGIGEPDAGGGLDITITEQFARSMSLDEAMAPGNLLCYEMNGEPLPAEHGAPVRLIAPGWYGVANVKWLSRIEVTDHRYAGRFMARDYVTFREHTDEEGMTTWTFETVGRFRLKSAPAHVVRNGDAYRVIGVAWGGAIAAVEVSIDGGEWQAAELADAPRHHGGRGLAWQFWTFDWGSPGAGQHTVASRAIDRNGEVQPAPDDPLIADKRTYWESNGQITRTVAI
jgi:DMSO/TMAO reductase YedYZ molybdopterin-dependent catalytic subunit